MHNHNSSDLANNIREFNNNIPSVLIYDRSSITNYIDDHDIELQSPCDCCKSLLFDDSNNQNLNCPYNTNSSSIAEEENENARNNQAEESTLMGTESPIRKPLASQRVVHFVEELRRRSMRSSQAPIDISPQKKQPISNRTSSESNYSSSNEGVFLLVAPSSPSANIGGNLFCNSLPQPCSSHCMSSNFDAYIGEHGGSNSGNISSKNYHVNGGCTNNNSRKIPINQGQYRCSALLSTCSLETAKIAQTSLANRFHCLCGSCHVVIGTKLFLVLYICLTVFGIVFGMISALVWTLIPIFVIPMALRAFWTRNAKYLYPFLIITVIQMVVCLIMAFIVTVFAILNYDKLSLVIAQTLSNNTYNNVYNNNNVKRHSSYFHSTSKFIQDASMPFRTLDYSTLAVSLITATIFACFLLSIFFGWQILVISSCIDYYEFNSNRNDEHNSTISKMSERMMAMQSSYFDTQSAAKMKRIIPGTTSTTHGSTSPAKWCSSGSSGLASQVTNSLLTHANEISNTPKRNSTETIIGADLGTTAISNQSINSPKMVLSPEINTDNLFILTTNTTLGRNVNPTEQHRSPTPTILLALSDSNLESKRSGTITTTTWFNSPIKISRSDIARQSLPHSSIFFEHL